MYKSTLKKQIKNYLSILQNENTKKSYSNAFQVLISQRILKPLLTVEEFSKLNVNPLLDKIKKIPDRSEATKQQYAAAFVSFTKYLNRITDGKTPVAIPEKNGINKTFYRIRDKVKTLAISPDQFNIFYETLLTINQQHAFIAKITYIGVKRVSEVLNLKIEHINPPEISFTQSKTRGTDKKTVITYKNEIFEELTKEILERESGFVFLENGEKIVRTRLNYTFSIASKRIDFKVTPHVLRASAITEYKRKGHTAEDISALSGTTEESVKKYDKRALAENISKTDPLL